MEEAMITNQASGISHVDSVTTKCWKGHRRKGMKAQRGMVLHAVADCSLQVCPLRLLAFSAVKQLVMMAYKR